MQRSDLGSMFVYFVALWFIAIGGPSTILPEVHRYIVEAHRLMSSAEFAELYTLAQAAPGPNAMYVTLIGWRVAGWSGVVVTTIPFVVPSISLTLLATHVNERYSNVLFIRALRQGLMPITIGLTFASATILMRATNHDWRAYLLTLLIVAIVLRKSWNPLWLLAAGALAGIVGLV